jgi:hypothetical protein
VILKLQTMVFFILLFQAPFAMAQNDSGQQSIQAGQQSTQAGQQSILDSQMPIRPASKMLQGGAETDTQMLDANARQSVGIPQTPPTYPQMPMNYQQPQMAPQYRAPVPMYAQQNSPMFLQAAVDSRGTPTLPPWKTQPEEIIGHFHVDFMGVSIKQVNGPTSPRIEFSKDERWRGNRHRPCFIWLTQVRDGSGGFYFHCMENRFGPSGWIYPIAKRGPEDKVTPWAIFFNQQ